MMMSLYHVVLANNDEGWVKLVVPIVIGIFYILSAIGKSKAGDTEKADKQGAARPQKPPTEPGRSAERPVPRRYTQTPAPVPRQRQTEAPVRVAKPVPAPVARPRPVEAPSAEQRLNEKLQRVKASGLQGARSLEKAVVPPAPPKAPVAATQQPAPSVSPARMTLERRLHETATLRDAIILREILDRPLGLR